MTRRFPSVIHGAGQDRPSLNSGMAARWKMAVMIVHCLTERRIRRLRTLLYTMKTAIAFIAAFFICNPAGAEVRLNSLFSDGAVLQRDQPIPVWGAARDGERVTVRLGGQAASAIATQGKWRVDLHSMSAGGPYELSVQGDNTLTVHDVLIGDVWIASGQSNMELTVAQCDRAAQEIANSRNPLIHLLRIPMKAADEPLPDVNASWKDCAPETVGRFSGVGYFFARDLQKALGIPLGLIDASYGGTPAEAWMSRKALQSRPEFQSILEEEAQLIRDSPRNMARYQADLEKWKKDAENAKAENHPAPAKPQLPFGPFNFRRPTGLYQGMILPVSPYAIRGVIWYQGERNSPRAYQYRTLFPALIADWRALWNNPRLPFLFVQLAPFGTPSPEPRDDLWAELREAQLMTSQTVAHTAMAVITDVGEQTNIHPVKKQPVGARLALAARALVYGEKIEYSGPIYRSMTIDGNHAVLSFDHVGQGLVAQDGPLTGFAICGADHKFVYAEAEIRGDEIRVWSPQVPAPVAVRYGWAGFPVVNLWNQDGLPASPFRTDDFPILSRPK